MDQSAELVRVLCGVVGFYCTQDLLQATGGVSWWLGEEELGSGLIWVGQGWLRLLVQVQIE